MPVNTVLSVLRYLGISGSKHTAEFIVAAGAGMVAGWIIIGPTFWALGIGAFLGLIVLLGLDAVRVLLHIPI